ncbi:hypothetical protein DDE82_001594 [Stemphylium lycopersici]|uniref:Uncharacterized protein n=1 Tax=Stemphylium lycopersici TaxID=183478 RepID=A0A364MZR5_STELY|nr:hypothetical protein TW65_03452 [Stemphylium lycopersici]RAR07995.1 hypothetical protein DDE83_006240 [Stemphylium lycopersici]RAR09877.1 hypothetical protein DDE82_001594 [Stemphylium lycopersici]
MSRNVPRCTVKRPSRRSLASLGIPDHRDVLTVYIHWARQRYYRAQDVMRQDATSVVASPHESGGAEPDEEQDATASPPSLHFDAERLGVDLLGTGSSFETEGSEYGYPAEIDVVG